MPIGTPGRVPAGSGDTAREAGGRSGGVSGGRGGSTPPTRLWNAPMADSARLGSS